MHKVLLPALVIAGCFFPAAFAHADDDRISGHIAEYSMDDMLMAKDRLVEIFGDLSSEEESNQTAEIIPAKDSIEIASLPDMPEAQAAPNVPPKANLREIFFSEPVLSFEDEAEEAPQTTSKPEEISPPPPVANKPAAAVTKPAILAPIPTAKPQPVIARAEEPVVIEAPPIPYAKPLETAEQNPLDVGDAAIYQRIFTLQAAGKMKDADTEMEKLKDARLRGHILYQRYMHPTSYVSSFEELRNWLALYGDYPGADRVYSLAMRKKPLGFSGSIPRPQKASTIQRKQEPMIYHGRTYKSPQKRSAAQQKEVQEIARGIIQLVNSEKPSQALKKLKSPMVSQALDNVEYDTLKARIAEGYLHLGETRDAYALASAAADRSGLQVPLAGWVAGLVAWGNGKYDTAARYFEIPARSSYASSWTASGGAFWAARANMRAGKSGAAKAWLKEAMMHPRTFYGLVAARAMGRGLSFNWAFPAFTAEHSQLLLKTPEGARAMALVEAGQIPLAEAELLRLNPQTPEMQEALLAYAGHAGLPALALRAGSVYEGPGGTYYDAALYPKGNWKPREAYRVDPDLVHAIMRQESKFDARAESSSGALGLMQLMPRTASYIAKQKTLNSREGQEMLLEPQTNLDIGEKYIVDLLKNKYVKGDLISMLIAYNAGPGNLKRWQEQWDGITDPLLFIELIPSRQTRAYVERVLANYWIYRFREGLDTPTLDALAKGKNAYYSDAQGAPDSPYRVAHN